MSTEKKATTPRKFEKKFREKTTRLESTDKEELQQVEDELNSIIAQQTRFEEDMLLTPESLKKSKSLTSLPSRSHGTSSSDSVTSSQNEQVSRNNAQMMEIRNQIFAALSGNPEYSQPSELRNRLIEQHILSLLKLSQPQAHTTSVPIAKSSSSSDAVPSIPASQSFSTPKRENSPPATDGRWAGLSSSPAPHQLPLPTFHGTPSRPEYAEDKLLSTSPSQAYPLHSVAPQRLFAVKPSPKHKKENRKLKDPSPKANTDLASTQPSPKEKRKFKPPKSKAPKISAGPPAHNLESLSSHLKSMLNIGDPRVQVAH